MRESDCGACAVESNCHIKRRALWTVTSTCAEIANWVHNWSKKSFCKKYCAPMYRKFYRNFTAIYRNFTTIFSGLGDRNPPPPPPGHPPRPPWPQCPHHSCRVPRGVVLLFKGTMTPAHFRLPCSGPTQALSRHFGDWCLNQKPTLMSRRAQSWSRCNNWSWALYHRCWWVTGG